MYSFFISFGEYSPKPAESPAPFEYRGFEDATVIKHKHEPKRTAIFVSRRLTGWKYFLERERERRRTYVEWKRGCHLKKDAPPMRFEFIVL